MFLKEVLELGANGMAYFSRCVFAASSTGSMLKGTGITLRATGRDVWERVPTFVHPPQLEEFVRDFHLLGDRRSMHRGSAVT